MKKALIALVVLIALGFGGLKWYQIANYGGTTYYTKVTTAGTHTFDKDDNGNKYGDYSYQLTGYDDHGKQQALDFRANRNRPLRRGAYLKLVYNDNKGVTSWEAVDAVDLPKAALTALK